MRQFATRATACNVLLALRQPIERQAHALGKQRNVETQFPRDRILLVLARRQQIYQQGRETLIAEEPRNAVVSLTEAAAAAAMNENDQRACSSGRSGKPLSCSPAPISMQIELTALYCLKLASISAWAL